MSIESHVVSLEMAKKLKEAGWKKETEFWWAVHRQILQPEYRNCVVLVKGVDESHFYSAGYWEKVNAPLSTEILEELPYKITDGDINYFLNSPD